MLIVQCANCKSVMMGACRNQTIKKACAVTQVKLPIPFQCALRDNARNMNHRVKRQLLLNNVLFAAVATSCQQFSGSDNRIRKFACGEIPHPCFASFVSAQVIYKNGGVQQARGISHFASSRYFDEVSRQRQQGLWLRDNPPRCQTPNVRQKRKVATPALEIGGIR